MSLENMSVNHMSSEIIRRIDSRIVYVVFMSKHVGAYVLTNVESEDAPNCDPAATKGMIFLYRRSEVPTYGIMLLGENSEKMALSTIGTGFRFRLLHRSVSYRVSESVKYLVMFKSTSMAAKYFAKLRSCVYQSRLDVRLVERGLPLINPHTPQEFLDHVDNLMGSLAQTTNAIEEELHAMYCDHQSSQSQQEEQQEIAKKPIAAPLLPGQVLFMNTVSPLDGQVERVPFRMRRDAWPLHLNLIVTAPASGEDLYLPHSLFYLDLVGCGARQPNYSKVVAELVVPSTVLGPQLTPDFSKLIGTYGDKRSACSVHKLAYLDLAGITHVRLTRELFSKKDVMATSPASSSIDTGCNISVDGVSSSSWEDVDEPMDVDDEEASTSKRQGRQIGYHVRFLGENADDNCDGEEDGKNHSKPAAYRIERAVNDHVEKMEDAIDLDDASRFQINPVAPTVDMFSLVLSITKKLNANMREKKAGGDVGGASTSQIDPAQASTSRPRDDDFPPHVLSIMHRLNANHRATLMDATDECDDRDDSSSERCKPTLNIQVVADVHFPDNYSPPGLFNASSPSSMDGEPRYDESESSSDATVSAYSSDGENHPPSPDFTTEIPEPMIGGQSSAPPVSDDHETPYWLRQPQVAGNRAPMGDLVVEPPRDQPGSSTEGSPPHPEPEEQMQLRRSTRRSVLQANANNEAVPTRPVTRRSFGKENCPPK